MELGVTAAPSSWVSGASSFPKQAFQDRQQESAKIDLEKALAYCNSSSEEEEENDKPVDERGATQAAMQASKPQISGRLLPASSMRTGTQGREDGSSGSSSEGRRRHGKKRRRHEKDGGGKKGKTGSKKSKRHSGKGGGRSEREREEYLRAEARAQAVLGGAIPERRGGTVWAGGDSLVGYALGYSGPDSLDKHLMCTDRCGSQE